MEDELLDPLKDDRRKLHAIFSRYDETVDQAVEQRQLPVPVVTDPNANPFPDVPLPADFREKPLPPISRRPKEPAVGDLTSDIEEALDSHERQTR